MDDLAGKPLWPGGKIHGILETDLDWEPKKWKIPVAHEMNRNKKS